jgi:hypothetical protein
MQARVNGKQCDQNGVLLQDNGVQGLFWCNRCTAHIAEIFPEEAAAPAPAVEVRDGSVIHLDVHCIVSFASYSPSVRNQAYAITM